MTKADFRIQMLDKEIDLVWGKIIHFDNLRWKTRQVALVLWTAAIGFGIQFDKTGLFFLASFLPIPFWIIETNYRRYYRGMNERMKAIRAFIRDKKYCVKGEKDKEAQLDDFLDDSKDCIFPVFDYWASKTLPTKVHKKVVSRLRNFFHRTNLLIYLLMILISVAIYLFSDPTLGLF